MTTTMEKKNMRSFQMYFDMHAFIMQDYILLHYKKRKNSLFYDQWKRTKAKKTIGCAVCTHASKQTSK